MAGVAEIAWYISGSQAARGVLGRGWRKENSLLRKGLAHLLSARLTSPPSPNNDIPHASGLKKTQGGGELRQKQ